MLKIRSEQIRVFQTDADTAFERRVMDYLKKNHAAARIALPAGKVPVAELSDEILIKLVRGALRRGKQYGIEWKSTLLSFVVLMFLTAPNFDRHPKAAGFFSENEVVDDERMKNFLDGMTDADWSEIEARYRPEAWMVPGIGEESL